MPVALRRRVQNLLLRLPARGLLFTEPEFVIVGTGRSGTGYVSQVLTSAGIRTGHENWWNPDATPTGIRLVGDASWCATLELGSYRGRVFHQIRNPLKVLRSVAELEVAPHRQENRWYRYRCRYVEMTGDPLVDAVVVVDKWLTEAERVSEWTWRLEDLNLELIEEIGCRLGLRVNSTRASKALSSADRNLKSNRKVTTLRFDWEDLPDTQEKQRILAIAEEYGYL